MSDDAGSTTLTATDDTAGNDATASNQTTQQNQGHDAAQSQQADGKQDRAPQGAPETYEDFKLPEGVQLDGKALESFTPIAKELNLSQAQAQQLVDYYIGRVNALQTAQIEALADVRSGWVEGIKTDAEIGGSAMAERVGLAVKALDKFGTPELRRALEESGLGDHPELVRVFYRVGKAISEDTINSGQDTTPPAEPKSHAQILYPNQDKI